MINGELIGFTVILLIFGPPAFLIVVSGLKKLRSSQDSPASGEEARLIQQMHQQLNRLEDRIEALETIVIETRSKSSSSNTH